MRNTLIYMLSLGLLLGLALWAQFSQPRRFVWRSTYAHRDTQPFGCAVFDSVLSQSLPHGYKLENKPLYVIGREDTAQTRNILVVSDNIMLGSNESDTLFRMLERGARIMLVASWFDRHLQDTLGIHCVTQHFDALIDEESSLFHQVDTLEWTGSSHPRRTFRVRSDFLSEGFVLTSPGEKTERPRVAGQGDFDRRVWVWQDNQLISCDSTFIRRVVAAVSVPVGRGELFLIRTPNLFTNFGILHRDYKDYVFRFINRLKEAPVVRTEVYCGSYDLTMEDYVQSEMHSPLDYFLSRPPLRWALYVALLVLLLLFCFTARRRQRPIPVVPPAENKTLEFVRLIGTLYFRRETPEALIRKKYLYFADEVQRRAGVNLHADSTLEERATRLAEKTGLAKDGLLSLLGRLERVCKEDAGHLSTEDMKRLVDRMNEVVRQL